jgi:hypothetical protein
MHIVAKILDDIHDALKNEYSIYVDLNDWELFKKSITDNKGEIDETKLKERQDKSVEIITKILKVHGKDRIVNYLGHLASLEPKIETIQPRMRDHVVHAINTFILGVFILEKVNFPVFKGARFNYPFMWKLCGPTHDLGYPIEIARNISPPFFADEMNGMIEEINSPSPKLEIETFPKNLDKLCNNIDSNQIIQKRLNDWALGIDVEDYYEWLKKKNRTDHGVVSALAQLKIIDALYFEENPNKEYRDIVKYVDNQKSLNFNQKNFDLDIVSASTALFIHNINRSYCGFSNKISFDIAPLAFLLFLCDTFQEWDRFSMNRKVYSGNDFDIECNHNMISLFVPEDLETDVYAALHQRLEGLPVRVNGRIAVT